MESFFIVYRYGSGLFYSIIFMGYIFKYTQGLIIYHVVLKFIMAFTGVLSYVYVAKVVLDAVQKEKTMHDVFVIIIAAVGINIMMVFLQSIYDESFLPQKKEAFPENAQ